MYTMKKLQPALLLLALIPISIAARADGPLLLRDPAISKTQIVFSYAGDLWSVPRDGGDAKRLTAGVGKETDPHFSPDGGRIAFTGEYDGNVDVYVMPSSGGVPKRLTFHPGQDEVEGWTNDGKSVLFRSHRDAHGDFLRLYTISVEGGVAEPIPLPRAMEGSYSPDGTHLAYQPLFKWQAAWKRYRGGQTTPIWIANLADSSIQKVPRENSNDSNPMWIGDKVYFLSDRGGPVSLFAYDTRSRKVSPVVKNTGLDIKSASASPDTIVYEQFGTIHTVDLATGKESPVNIRIAADLPEVRSKFVRAAKYIRGAALSPSGARAVFEARGDIVTVPADKGDFRNLTSTSGIAERDPSWSPDGKYIAYFSDESGDYALHVRQADGKGEVRKFPLGESSFFYEPVWSPDSKKIAYSDKRLNLWILDLGKKTPVKVDTTTYDSPLTGESWSPDSRWLAYPKQLRNFLHAIQVYSLESGKSSQITDGMSDAEHPVFDRGGKYLYFTASTDVGLTLMGLDMSSEAHPVTRSAYVCVLRNDIPSPLAPESDEEKAKEDAAKPADDKKPADAAAKDKDKDKDKEKDKQVRIDLDNIGQRILALPVPPRNYNALATGKEGILFLSEVPVVMAGVENPAMSVQRFELAKRKSTPVVAGVRQFIVSENGEKALYRQGDTWAITDANTPVKPGDGALKIADIELRVDPQAEWKQIYREVWRIERDFFYDPNLHGLDLAATTRKYEPYLENISTRADLNYLFEEMLGEITVGHMFIEGGDLTEAPQVRGGLLGADWKPENGHVRFTRVYNGENWNPQMRAPLTQPGVNVKSGEYLIAINGSDAPPIEELYRLLEATAGRQVTLKVGPNPDGSNSREVTVVPIANDSQLRYLAWIEDNRRKVDQLSGGRLAYVHLPDTANGGFTNFNRYFFAQVGKDGAVLDERFNHGGQLADYIIDYLKRPMMSRVVTREGEGWSSPSAAIYGPKAMIINEMAGSGGDAMPWYFRKAGLGPLIGKRTWGGLVGIGGYPDLIDGGNVTAPRMAIYGLKGEWEVENVGVSPDIEVDWDPALWRQGHDPQLEKAVEVVMEELKKNPPPTYKLPTYPNYHKKG
jgi:tricorn protease